MQDCKVAAGAGNGYDGGNAEESVRTHVHMLRPVGVDGYDALTAHANGEEWGSVGECVGGLGMQAGLTAAMTAAMMRRACARTSPRSGRSAWMGMMP